MSDRRPLPTLLSELGGFHPKLVLMRGDDYYRIEDLVAWARRDAASGKPKEREALSAAIYWHTTDERGKILIKGIDPRGEEFVAFVEPGSSARAQVP